MTTLLQREVMSSFPRALKTALHLYSPLAALKRPAAGCFVVVLPMTGGLIRRPLRRLAPVTEAAIAIAQIQAKDGREGECWVCVNRAGEGAAAGVINSAVREVRM